MSQFPRSSLGTLERSEQCRAAIRADGSSVVVAACTHEWGEHIDRGHETRAYEPTHTNEPTRKDEPARTHTRTDTGTGTGTDEPARAG